MTVQKNNKAYIFDTNIFFTGIDFNLIDAPIYTTISSIKEIEVEKYKAQNRTILNRIQVALESKRLILKTPSRKYIQKVEKKSRKTGDAKTLSKTDIELIALSLELKNSQIEEVTLYTNDYSMENLCLELGISFSPLYKNGIKVKILWEYFCPLCSFIANSDYLYDTCEICGQKLKRRQKIN